MDDLFHGGSSENFCRTAAFLSRGKETCNLIAAILFARWRVENIVRQRWQVISDDEKVIRLGNFQYALAIKVEYGFSTAIGIKVILVFALGSNEFSE